MRAMRLWSAASAETARHGRDPFVTLPLFRPHHVSHPPPESW